LFSPTWRKMRLRRGAEMSLLTLEVRFCTTTEGVEHGSNYPEDN
jgi:hypothetical protein